MGGVRLWEASANGRCALLGGVRLWELSRLDEVSVSGGSAVELYSFCFAYFALLLKNMKYKYI